jgi:hypothetical protein
MHRLSTTTFPSLEKKISSSLEINTTESCDISILLVLTYNPIHFISMEIHQIAEEQTLSFLLKICEDKRTNDVLLVTYWLVVVLSFLTTKYLHHTTDR